MLRARRNLRELLHVAEDQTQSPSTSRDDGDLTIDQQLDELLDQIESVEPGLKAISPRPPRAAGRASHATSSPPPAGGTPVEASPAAADGQWTNWNEADLAASIDAALREPPATVQPAPAAAPAADVGEELASQIQELLDEQRSGADAGSLSVAPRLAAPPPASTIRAPTDDSHSINTADGMAQFIADLDKVLAGEAEENTFAADTKPGTAAPADVSAYAPAVTDDELEELVGAFESPDQVLSRVDVETESAAGDKAKSAGNQPAVSAPTAGTPVAPLDDADDLEGVFETPEEVHAATRAGTGTASTQASADHVACGDDRVIDVAEMETDGTSAANDALMDDLEGAFESPETIAAQGTDTGVAGFTAAGRPRADAREPAAGVAAEEPQEAGAEPAPVLATIGPQPVNSGGSGRALGWGRAAEGAGALLGALLIRAAARLPRYLARTCQWMNRPLARLSPTTRNLVGYCGLVSLFWAVVLLLGKAAATLFSGA